jgi:hypothetical protein
MKWTEPEQAPKLGEWLRRKDTGVFAQVDHIAALGIANPPVGMPLYEGDVVVVLRYGPGHDCVTPGGPYFWTKWERFDVERAARKAIRIAHAALEDV